MRTTIIGGLLALGLLASGCTGEPGSPTDVPGEDRVRVVTTFSLLGDLVRQVGGEHVHVHSMVPLGTNPHEYQPLPADIEAATRADLLVWNGLDMETGDGWFAGLVDVAGKAFDTPQVVEASVGVEPMWLNDGAQEEVNPHAFLSPRAGMVYTENIAAALEAVDLARGEEYRSNASRLLEQIGGFDDRYARELGAVRTPVLITSERAFQYVAADYGLLEGYLWQIDTDEQGTPAQITALIDFVAEHGPAGLLVETNVDTRPMRAVAQETGVPIVAEVYSDELGPPGSPGETYLGYLESNLEAYLAAMGE